MSSKKWELSKDLAEKGSEVYNLLSMELEDLQGRYEDMSENWKDKDKGQAVNDWLNVLQNVLEAMEEFESEPETV